MSTESRGLVLGTDIPMRYSDEAEYLVLSVTEFASVRGSDVVGPPLPLPYAHCDVEIFANNTEGFPLAKAVLPIMHREDFKLIWFLSRSGIVQSEDVILRVTKRGGVLGRLQPVVAARSQDRGTFHAEIRALLARKHTGTPPTVHREFEPGPFDPTLWRLMTAT